MNGEESEDYTNLSKNLCITQMSEASKTKGLIKYLIKDNATIEDSWANQLMPILCEYYTTIHQYYELLSEVLFNAPFNEEKPEYLMVDLRQLKTLRAHVSLLQINEYDLLYNYRISLTIH